MLFSIKNNILIKYFFYTALVLISLYNQSACAQKINISTFNCRLNKDDRAYLEKIAKFEAKFYNIIFNTLINDSLPVNINLYGKQNEYNSIQKKAMNTTFIDGFYDPEVNRIFLSKTAFYMNTLLHETSHSLLENNYKGSPLWLNEGIATLFGSLVIQNDEVYYTKNEYNIKFVKDMMYKHEFSLYEFFKYSNLDFANEQKRPYVYAVSYCLIYFMVKDDINNLQQLTLLLKSGYSTNAAIAKVFGSFNKFEKRFTDFYKPEVGYRL